MKIQTPRFPRRRLAARVRCTCLLCGVFCSPLALAQSPGITTQGVTGGLVIPYADVLAPGTLAFTYGNYQDPALGKSYPTQQNLSVGVGLMPQVEFFGRFAEYTQPGGLFVSGIRDISANLKVQIPLPWPALPKLALGLNDIAGGAVFFKSGYAVASDQYGPFTLALGYAKGQSRGTTPSFDGLFRGVNVRLNDQGLSGLAEFEGQQKHLGLRWMSLPIDWLANAQFIGNLQRTFSSNGASGLHTPSNHFAFSLVLPLGVNDARLANFSPTAQDALPALDARVTPSQAGMKATAQDQLDAVYKKLLALGLERVRVGRLGAQLMVEYENHRYAHNEVDALGLIFAVAAELAPTGTSRVHALTLKGGMLLYESSVDVAAYRKFLRDGSALEVRDSLDWQIHPQDRSAQTDWSHGQPSFAAPLRLEIKPDLNYTVGTEIGALDYALAANVQLTVPIRQGGNLLANYVLPMSHSENMNAGAPFAIYLQRQGLKTLALQQSFWLGNLVLAQATVGSFDYGTLGLQGQATVLLPGTDDVLRLRAAGYSHAPGGLTGQDRAFAASYRYLFGSTTYLEVGAQRYGDGSQGPTLEWTRWFGDVSAQVFYRKGGNNRFAGLQLSFPLTPRRGMEPKSLFVTGASQYAQSFRTRLTSSNSPVNNVIPGAVRDLRFETSLDDNLLNSGRISRQYISDQIYRMREAYFSFARQQ